MPIKVSLDQTRILLFVCTQGIKERRSHLVLVQDGTVGDMEHLSHMEVVQ